MEFKSFAALLGVLAYLILCAGTACSEGIPEPPITIYGVVTDEHGKRITEGVITISISDSAGKLISTATTTLSDINRQFSYVVSFPCETAIAGTVVSVGALPLASSAPVYKIKAKIGDVAALFFHSSAGSTFSGALTTRGVFLPVNLSTVPYTDTDNDGLLDSWEKEYFGHLGHAAGDDFDHDKVNNLTEQFAGTHPKIPAATGEDFLQVVHLAPDKVLLVWSSTANTTYKVYRSAKLDARDPAGGFAEVASVTADGNVASYTNTISQTDPAAAFYRIGTQP